MLRAGRDSARTMRRSATWRRSAEAYARSHRAATGSARHPHEPRATSLKSLGRQAEALREYRAAIALKPEFGEVYWSMANLKVFRFEPQEVAAMEEQLRREDLTESAAVHFRFALGKAYEDAGDYDRAFENYRVRQPAAQRPSCPMTRWASSRATRRSRRFSASDFLQRHAGQGLESDAPDLHRRACRDPARR